MDSWKPTNVKQSDFKIECPNYGLDVLRSLCKAGLPEGNVYEYSALKILKFEKQFRAEQRKKELLLKYKLDEDDKGSRNNSRGKNYSKKVEIFSENILQKKVICNSTILFSDSLQYLICLY